MSCPLTATLHLRVCVPGDLTYDIAQLSEPSILIYNTEAGIAPCPQQHRGVNDMIPGKATSPLPACGPAGISLIIQTPYFAGKHDLISKNEI